MKLIVDLFENPIILSKDYVTVLHIENKHLYSSFCMLLNNIEENRIILFDDNGNELLPQREILTIYAPYNFDFNSKEISGKVFKIIENELWFNLENQNELRIKYNDFINKFIKLSNLYENNLDLDIELDLKKLCKFLNIRPFIEDSITFLDKILKIIVICAQYDLCKILVLNGIEAYFNDKELLEIYKIAEYNKIQVLILEQTDSEKKIYNENLIVIDKDFYWLNL